VAEATPIEIRPVEWARLVVVLPMHHPLTRRKRVTLSDLANEAFIMYSASSAVNLRAQVMLVCQTAGFTSRVTQEAVQVQTLVSLVEAASGWHWSLQHAAQVPPGEWSFAMCRQKHRSR
jgi:DNA-binding transcriptional LysR family regulator